MPLPWPAGQAVSQVRRRQTWAIAAASAKVRTGPPIDAPEDYALPMWAGEIPLRLMAVAPVADERCLEQLEVPRYAVAYRRAVKGNNCLGIIS